MNPQENQNLIFRIIEYGLQKEVFSLNSLKEELKLDELTFQFVFNNLFAVNDQQSSNHLIATVQSVSPLESTPLYTYYSLESRLLPSAIFQYVDYLEIKAARETAKESKKLAWIAIWISAGIGLASLIVGSLQLFFQK